MSTAIELAFVVFGLAALLWAIASPSAHPATRVGAGLFGVVTLAIGLLLRGEDAEHRRDW